MLYHNLNGPLQSSLQHLILRYTISPTSLGQQTGVSDILFQIHLQQFSVQHYTCIYNLYHSTEDFIPLCSGCLYKLWMLFVSLFLSLIG